METKADAPCEHPENRAAVWHAQPLHSSKVASRPVLCYGYKAKPAQRPAWSPPLCGVGVRAHRIDLEAVLLLDPLSPPLLVARRPDASKQVSQGGPELRVAWDGLGCSPRPSPISASVSSIGRLLFLRIISFRSYSSTSGDRQYPFRLPPVNSYAASTTAVRVP